MNPSKKYQQDIKDLTEHRQNLLDKLSDKVYNIRTGLKKTNKNMNIDLTTYSKNAAQSEFNDRRLSEVYNTLSEITKAEYGITPVIAGGAVRDTLLGCHYRDIDVFFYDDPKEDVSDFLVYVTELFRDSPLFNGEGSASSAGYPAASVGKQYKDSAFTSYELRHLPRYSTIQFMAGSSAKTPEEVVEAFDYDLVRCWYDGTYHVTEDFDRAVRKGRTMPPTKNAWYRARDFRDRTGYKIVVANPPKEALTGSTSSSSVQEVIWKAIPYDAF